MFPTRHARVPAIVLFSVYLKSSHCRHAEYKGKDEIAPIPGVKRFGGESTHSMLQDVIGGVSTQHPYLMHRHA